MQPWKLVWPLEIYTMYISSNSFLIFVCWTDLVLFWHHWPVGTKSHFCPMEYWEYQEYQVWSGVTVWVFFLWRLKTAQIPLNRKGWLSRIYESMQKLTSQSLRIYRCKQVLLQVAQCRWDSSILRIGRSEVEITLHFPGFELHGMYSWRSCRVQAVKSKKWHWIEFSSSPFCFWTYNSVVLWEFMDRLIPSVI